MSDIIDKLWNRHLDAIGQPRPMTDDEFVAKSLEGMAACIEDANGRLGHAGSITCPACGGTLKYLTASYPKARHKVVGKCDTTDCLAWQ